MQDCACREESEDTVTAGGSPGGSREDVIFEFIPKDEFYLLEGREECGAQPQPGFPESSTRGLSPDVHLDGLQFRAHAKKWVEDLWDWPGSG